MVRKYSFYYRVQIINDQRSRLCADSHDDWIAFDTGSSSVLQLVKGMVAMPLMNSDVSHHVSCSSSLPSITV